MTSERLAIDPGFKHEDALRATVIATPTPPRAAKDDGAPVRWPLALCFFVAMMSATVAFLTSPLAAHPSITPYTTALNQLVDG